jgi:predicted dienelactone hydrolase
LEETLLRFLTWILTVSLGASALGAQQPIDVPRSDGHTTPLLVYRANPAPATGCAPLAVISHGAGGSEDGYKYLAHAMELMGYTTVVMGHRESGMSALRSDMRTDGIRDGITALVSDPVAEGARLMDVTAALAWADKQCHAPFRVLLGHSMGAETVMLEAGAKNMIDVDPGLTGKSRFDAYVALSPEGPGVVFPEHAWGGIRKPVLVLTGTDDQSLKGGPTARLVPWHELPGNRDNCQWMGVIDRATHMNFAGNGFGHLRVEPMVTETIASFLQGVQARHCTVSAPVKGMTLQAK